MPTYERFAFNKLATGGLPAKLQCDGCRVGFHTPTLEELTHEFPRKLGEEMDEAWDALARGAPAEICAELADVREVLLAMHMLVPQLLTPQHDTVWEKMRTRGQCKGVELPDIEAARHAKRAKKGGMETSILLEHIDVPLGDETNAAWLELFRSNPQKYPSLGRVE